MLQLATVVTESNVCDSGLEFGRGAILSLGGADILIFGGTGVLSLGRAYILSLAFYTGTYWNLSCPNPTCLPSPEAIRFSRSHYSVVNVLLPKHCVYPPLC